MDGNEHIIITNQWKIKRNEPLSEGEVLLKYNFTPHSYTHTIRWDDEVNTTQHKAIKVLKRHPQLQVEGNTNLKSAMFKLTNSFDEKIERVTQNKRKLTICNIINNMTGSEVRDIAFWNRIPNVDRLDIWDLQDQLINLQSGKLISSAESVNHFFANYKLEGINQRVIAEKAIVLGIVTTRTGFLYYENTQIGKSVEDVIDFMIQNKDSAEYIKKDVYKKDQLPADWSTKTILQLTNEIPSVSEQLGKTKAQAKIEEDDKMAALRFEANSLGIKGAHLMKEETLKEKIAEKQASLSTVTA